MGSDQWHVNYLGLFLSVSGIILVAVCGMIAYNALDFTEARLTDRAAASTLPAITITIPPSSTTSTTSTTTTTFAPAFEDRNRQDFLAAIDTLMSKTRVKLTVFDNALEAGDDETTQRLAGELALLWNAAPPRAPRGVSFAAEWEEARNSVGDTFLALYDALERRSRSDTAEAKTQVQIVALPLIESLQKAIAAA